jgi:dephospho-CoA kinase
VKPETPKIIAITGGIGAGKSAVTKLFEEWGAQTVDADVLAREVVEPGSQGYQRVVENFSEDMVLADGSINRPRLASMIFSEPDKKKLLENGDRWEVEIAANIAAVGR